MKIAVLFGSFNPLTRAHVAMLQSAVAQIGADRGLFVATNGAYLKRKTIKINDPFYLTEDVRRSIIERTCAEDARLAFGGFELGGINPNRYKTLCKLQKQYPDARLYEVMGADKVHTLYKSAVAEDYLSNIHFAVFARNEIDLAETFAQSPLLEAHRDSFVLLPALSQISSTEVRRRFYAGEDYTDLVPPAAAEVLAQHQPTDFTVDFSDRLATIMRSGRFGHRQACKEVYQDNARRFLQWKAGTSDVAFGDHQAFLDNTRLYDRAYSVAELGQVYPETQTGCINIDCAELARQLMQQGYDPAILNLASAKSPGGGYHQGYGAQEESLCHISNLSLSLYQYGSPRFKHIRESGAPHKCDGYPLDLNFGGIYTPGVTFFRNPKAQFFSLRNDPFTCDVITVAALSFNGRTEFCGVKEISYRADDGGFTPEGEAIMLNKIRTIFRMGVEHGKDALVLGAFGCGAYKLPVPEVVRLFRTVMGEPEFAGKFRLIAFAILESSRKPNGLNGKFADFYREFGTLTTF